MTTKHITIQTLMQLKQQAEKFSCLTVYDATFAQLLSQAGIQVLLIGDTLGNVIQGHATTLPVTIEKMAYHTQCVSRGNQGSFLITDLPFMTYATVEQALHNSTILMQAGAHMVKLEGGHWLADTVYKLNQCGIPVCGHLGLTPQSVHKLGGYSVQGKDENQAKKIMDDAKLLEEAGISLLVLECVPSNLATQITKNLNIPIIGIGAGPNCDAQLLVLYDMLGITPGKPFKFCKNFMQNQTSIQAAIMAYMDAVKNHEFPGAEHEFQ